MLLVNRQETRVCMNFGVPSGYQTLRKKKLASLSWKHCSRGISHLTSSSYAFFLDENDVEVWTEAEKELQDDDIPPSVNIEVSECSHE